MQMKRPSRKRFHLLGRLSSPQPSNCPHFICLRAIPEGSHRVGGSLGWGWNVRLSLPVILATEQGGWSPASLVAGHQSHSRNPRGWGLPRSPVWWMELCRGGHDGKEVGCPESQTRLTERREMTGGGSGAGGGG